LSTPYGRKLVALGSNLKAARHGRVTFAGADYGRRLGMG
jgi:ribose/xylose/arabinose/galactoside ABC-type transport system permease subunit